MEAVLKESKIALYDSEDNKIGETFMRRAKQLVKQQRAFWADDKQTELKFLPGMENFVVPDAPISEETAAATAAELETPPKTLSEESWIVLLAEQRIKTRKLFIWHSIALIPGFIALYLFVIMWVHWSNQGIWIGMLWSSWATLYITHFCVYFKNNAAVAKMSTGRKLEKAERKKRQREMQLALEIAKIKAAL
ncbi:MAG: hypothetical protein FWG68_02090 [Defluviitaleaceae bacterium]|nr:hypothetical protein [Defluviitaleaceae bacterium]